jgi:hypothetical protein
LEWSHTLCLKLLLLLAFHSPNVGHDFFHFNSG